MQKLILTAFLFCFIPLLTAKGEPDLTKPLDLKFTSVDGKTVDLSKMRGKVVLVDFWATWCPPCRAVAPELAKVAEQRAGGVVVAKVDTDALPDVAARFSIRSIPTMILFRDGREVKRVSGAMPASEISAQLAL